MSLWFRSNAYVQDARATALRERTLHLAAGNTWPQFKSSMFAGTTREMLNWKIISVTIQMFFDTCVPVSNKSRGRPAHWPQGFNKVRRDEEAWSAKFGNTEPIEGTCEKHHRSID